MAHRPSRTAVRRAAVAATLALVAATALIACHPLVNPVDPRATNYTGTPTSGDPNDPSAAPEPLLPPIARWELVAPHDPGRMLPLEIPNDESFIEPRDSSEFECWITLSDSFEWEQAEGAICWIAVSFMSGDTLYTGSPLTGIAPEQRRLSVDLDTSTIPDQTRIRLRLVDRNGTIIGERIVGRLIGDVDGTGTIDTATDRAKITSLEGFAVSTDNPNTIRVDLDLDGIIEGSGGDDWALVSSPGAEPHLPATAPEFWD